MAVVRTIDHGLDDLLRQADVLNGSGVKVGIQADVANYIDNRMDVLDVAMINEFGTATIPARPFVAGAADKYRQDIATVMDGLGRKVESGSANADTAMEELGQWYEARQKDHIRSGEFEENAASTIAKKGSSVPLIDNAIMINTVRYEVLKK